MPKYYLSADDLLGETYEWARTPNISDKLRAETGIWIEENESTLIRSVVNTPVNRGLQRCEWLMRTRHPERFFDEAWFEYKQGTLQFRLPNQSSFVVVSQGTLNDRSEMEKMFRKGLVSLQGFPPMTLHAYGDENILTARLYAHNAIHSLDMLQDQEKGKQFWSKIPMKFLVLAGMDVQVLCTHPIFYGMFTPDQVTPDMTETKMLETGNRVDDFKEIDLPEVTSEEPEFKMFG
jgi:hypothetical protein